MTENPAPPTPTNRLRNLLIALAAIALTLAFFLGFQTQVNSTSLDAQAQQATPLKVALTNGRPTLVEFYANWCTSCQAMAPDLAKIKQKKRDSVNFVMLNVDNTKWLPEILRYRVDGIPHFVFFDQTGEETAQVIGEQPLPIMEANLEALVANAPLPYALATGKTSQVKTSLQPSASAQDDPRSHGAQVQ